MLSMRCDLFVPRSPMQGHFDQFIRLHHALVVALLWPAVAVRAEAEPGAAPHDRPEARVSFNEHIRPILANHCVACHGGVKQASGLSLIYRDKALAEGESGGRAIVPGNIEESYLVERISDPDPDYRMPPADHGPALSLREIELVKQWISEGAEWEEHWSFVAPERHAPPETSRPNWAESAIDPFVLARLDAERCTPSPAASKSEWLRRVTFDLVGLPPSAEDREAFLADDSEQAYEKVVDRLLALPHFGERWAAMWLDLARYADTMGYEKDPHRDIWPYRDWLIRSLNDDMPYDQFLVKQLAGDLLPGADLSDRVATAFHRNTQTNTEGGTDDEEFRIAAVIDRVNTTWQVVGGLTFGCCQCHSHPYDPIEHEEFYRFLAVFNSTRDCDLDEETPQLDLPIDRADWPRAEELDRRISELRRTRHSQLMPLAEAAHLWRYLEFDEAKSTGETQLVLRENPADGLPEFVTQGTVTAHSMYQLSLRLPAGIDPVTAVRLESLPQDLGQALQTPEMGFAVTRLMAAIEVPGESVPRPLFVRVAMCDEPEPLLDPEDCASDNNNGWAVYPKLDRPRWAVFVFDEPVAIPAGSRLQLKLKQNRSATGEIALVVNRGRVGVSSDKRWAEVVASERFQALENELAELRAERSAMASTSLPVIDELDPLLRRHTYVFERGNWLDKGKEVTPGVPTVFPALDTQGSVDRLAVARWFASPTHPLTSRVLVNRVWEQLFAKGLVETVGDFGTSGTLPSHPQLLDDLAARFQTDMQWSFKQLLRELVLSATYRQQSRATAQQVARDPENRLLGRGPRERLTAEMVRDQALVLSGRLSPQRYGPSVMPPQPEGVWRSVYSGAQWRVAEGDDRYRRGVYTYWKRTSPYPSMLTFDAPSREVCSVRRIATNTPLQPLVTMNDPVFVECAQGLAERMQQEGGETTEQQVAWALERATTDEPRRSAVAALVALYDDAFAAFDPRDPEMTVLGQTSTAYASTIVASAILNLDDVMTK